MQINLTVGDLITIVGFVAALIIICGANRPRSRSRAE
jgi:hypothetical protein